MKSLRVILAIAVMAFFVSAATAQKKPEERAIELRTESMVSQYNLDKQQHQKLLVLNKKMMADRKNLKGKGKSDRDKGKADYHTALKKILTTEQYSKWAARQGG